MIAARLLSGLAVCKAARISDMETELSTDLGDHGGVIRVGDGSRCLDVYGNNIHASRVTIYAAVCNGDKGQVWKHDSGALKNVASGKCLDIDNASSKNGANLILYHCNGQRNQQFQFNKASNSISQPKSSKCLDVDMASNIKNVLLWTCKTSQNQKMGWAAEWSLSQDFETLKVGSRGISCDDFLKTKDLTYFQHEVENEDGVFTEDIPFDDFCDKCPFMQKLNKEFKEAGGQELCSEYNVLMRKTSSLSQDSETLKVGSMGISCVDFLKTKDDTYFQHEVENEDGVFTEDIPLDDFCDKCPFMQKLNKELKEAGGQELCNEYNVMDQMYR